MRHAAAKAVADLGLSGAGLVRVRGWFAATPDWQEPHRPKPEDIQKMPDTDPREHPEGGGQWGIVADLWCPLVLLESPQDWSRLELNVPLACSKSALLPPFCM